MICEHCEEKIEYEVVILDMCRERLYFCDEDCKNSFIDDRTTNEILDKELDALEDKYYDYK